MAQSLDDFIKQATAEICEFEKYWRRKNAEDPEHFPMEMVTGNEGLWWEFLQGGIDEGDD